MIVLDSHVWFWWIALEHRRLPTYLVARIEDADQVGVSPVSCFELALAHKKGRLALPCSPARWFDDALAGSGITLLPLSPQIAARAVALSPIATRSIA